MVESDISPSTIVGDSSLKRKRPADDASDSAATSQAFNPKAKSPSTPPKKMTAAKKLSLSKPQSFVTFVVGEDEEKQTFAVHKSFATSQSSVFEKAFNDSELYSCKTQTLELPYLDPEYFGYVVHWLYFKELEVEEHHTTIAVYFEIYEMVSKLQLVGLQSHVLKKMMDEFLKLDGEEKLQFINWAYCDSSGIMYLLRTPIRRMIVDVLAWGMEPEKLGELKEHTRKKTGTQKEMLTGLWMDVAMVLSKHAWDKLPTKYFGKVRTADDYMVEEREFKKE